MIPGLVGLLKASPPRSGPHTPSPRVFRGAESQGRDGGASGAAAG